MRNMLPVINAVNGKLRTGSDPDQRHVNDYIGHKQAHSQASAFRLRLTLLSPGFSLGNVTG